ncbi:hypothetical protein BH10PSE19_BH10PSE19_23010 [soil metagenome]
MLTLRKAAINEEIDYLFLKNALKSYRSPRAKISALLRDQVLIRVKKGLYVFGPEYAQKPFVKETLANLIYGPSCISLEYALSFYGFIPERVTTITSITNKKDKFFATPVGNFSYRYLHSNKYSVGITQILYDQTHPILIATPEKALADKILLTTPNLKLTNQKELLEFLYDDLRISDEKIKSLNKNLFNEIAACYFNANISHLNNYLLRRQ